MAIDLRDITKAVQSYLNKKVTIAITELTPADKQGDEVNPGETFEVHLEATNADAESGGVALKNLKYRVSVGDGSVAKLIAQNGVLTHTTDGDGNDVDDEAELTSMIIQNFAGSDLAIGESSTLVVKGKANKRPSGGSTKVTAQVLADVDLDELFPQGEDTRATDVTLEVAG